MSGHAVSQAPREPLTRIWFHGAPTVRRRDSCGTELRPQAPIRHEVSTHRNGPIEQSSLQPGELLELFAYNIPNPAKRTDEAFGLKCQTNVHDLWIINRTADLTHRHAVCALQSGDAAGRVYSNSNRCNVVELPNVSHRILAGCGLERHWPVGPEMH